MSRFADRAAAGRELAQRLEPFRSVGLWYDDFAQTSDDDVRAIVERARTPDRD